MNLSNELLSSVTIYSKYSRYLPSKNRRETWEEIVNRNKSMHLKKYPKLREEIEANYKYVLDKKVLPSLRGMQFGGKPIEISNTRQYNCGYIPIDHYRAFDEIAFLLLGGSGIGFSVQRHHVDQLPPVVKPTKKRRYLIGDSIEGWSESIKALMKAYLCGKSLPVFDFRDIRPRGRRLITSGGIAPGPEPLKDCLHNIQKVLDRKVDGEKLRPIECHDVVCHISDCILAGGIRRSATLSLFDHDDYSMLTSKYNSWWEHDPQRARANNSALLMRDEITEEQFFELWKKIEASGSGEPGFYWSNSRDMGINACQPSFATVLTQLGIRKFGSINVGDLIWSKTGWTTVTHKRFTGTKQVYKYTTTSGEFIGTSDHKIVENGEKVMVGWAKGIDSIQGPIVSSENNHNQQAVMDGLVMGDGSIHMGSKHKIYLIIGGKDSDYFGDKVSDLIIGRHACDKKNAWKIKTTLTTEDVCRTYNRRVPDNFFYGSPDIIASFLRGLFSANGCISGKRVSLKSTSYELIIQVQQMLSSIGISSYRTLNKPKCTTWRNGTFTGRESYDINITKDLDKFMSSIGFIQKYKTDIALEVLANKFTSKLSRHKRKDTYEIIVEESLGEHEVFNITVNNESHTYWTGGVEVSNCQEASLEKGGLCNLTTMNVSDVHSQTELNNRAKCASFIGTLQAGYTDFHYVRELWQTRAEKDALLGVSMTGIASGGVLSLSLSDAANVVLKENERVAELIGINKGARNTITKPEGTSSCVLGCSSGIHPYHSEHYIRRMRLLKTEPLYSYIAETLPDLVEDDFLKPKTQAVLSLPQKAPEGSIYRTESPLKLLERIKHFTCEWIKPGHRSGANTHSVSATVSIKDKEWDRVGKWMWENKDYYNGLSVIPFDIGSYRQPPFEDCDEETYNSLMKKVRNIDLSQIVEEDDTTKLREESACAGGACTVTQV